MQFENAERYGSGLIYGVMHLPYHIQAWTEIVTLSVRLIVGRVLNEHAVLPKRIKILGIFGHHTQLHHTPYLLAFSA